MYRCVSITPEGFIQQLAVCYVGRGYWFYVTGTVPEHKDPASVDRKLIERYRIDLSKWAKARRKLAGTANVQYLRHGRFFVLLATHGHHDLFSTEASVIRDARRSPIRFAGYSVSYRGGHPHVRIDRDAYLELKAWMLTNATGASIAELFSELRRAPYEPYAPVRRQLLCIWRAVNRARKLASLEPLPVECIRMKRRIVLPFGAACDDSRLLPAREELAPTVVSTESDHVDAHPQSASGRVDRVEVPVGPEDGFVREHGNAGTQEAERGKIDGHHQLTPTATGNHLTAARVARLEYEDRLSDELVDTPLDLVEPEFDVLLGPGMPKR